VIHREQQVVYGGFGLMMFLVAVVLFVSPWMIPNRPIVKIGDQGLKLAEAPISVASAARNTVQTQDNWFEVTVYDQGGISSKSLAIEGYELGNPNPLYRVPVISMDAKATKWSSMVNIPTEPKTRFVVLTLEYQVKDGSVKQYPYVLFLTDSDKESDAE